MSGARTKDGKVTDREDYGSLGSFGSKKTHNRRNRTTLEDLLKDPSPHKYHKLQWTG